MLVCVHFALRIFILHLFTICGSMLLMSILQFKIQDSEIVTEGSNEY